MAEVGFETLAGVVVERDEGLGRARLLRADIQPDAFGAAGVAVLVAEAAEELGGGVPLLRGRLRVGTEDVVDERLERIEKGRRCRAPGVGPGLGVAEDLADLAARVMEAACQFTDAKLLNGVCPADVCVLVHLDHPAPPCSWTPKRCTSLQEMRWGWARFRRGCCLGVGPNWTRVSSLPSADRGRVGIWLSSRNHDAFFFWRDDFIRSSQLQRQPSLRRRKERAGSGSDHACRQLSAKWLGTTRHAR